jgi:hypothetical protein
VTDAPRSSALATWALGLAIIFVIPFLPVVGAVLGVVAYVRIRRSAGRLTGEGRALTAVIVGLFAGAVSFVAFYAVVLPGWIGAGDRARYTNAAGHLRDVERGLYRYHAARGRFPVGETGWTPEEECCAGATSSCRLDPEDWTSDPVWLAIGYVPRTAPAFQLRYASEDGQAFVIEARGDLECDGTPELLRMKGRIGPAGIPRTGAIETLGDGGANRADGAPGAAD